jgi:hypothetical protein
MQRAMKVALIPMPLWRRFGKSRPAVRAVGRGACTAPTRPEAQRACARADRPLGRCGRRERAPAGFLKGRCRQRQGAFGHQLPDGRRRQSRHVVIGHQEISGRDDYSVPTRARARRLGLRRRVVS